MFYPRTVKLNDKDVLVDDTQCVDFREHLQSHRVLFLSGIITNEFSSHNLLMAMDTQSHTPIRLVITSVGGDLDASFLLYDTMKMIKSPIETLGRYCASAAAIILAAGSKRYLLPHAKVMLHLPSSYFQKDTAVPFQEMEIYQKEAMKYKNKMVNLLRECGVKKSHDEILTDIDRNFWLEPDQAIEYGLADELMTPEIWQSWIKEIK